jgi:transglutaminase-like putative cysteine protease
MLWGVAQMELIFESQSLSAYLEETDILDFHSPLLQKKIKEITKFGNNETEKAKMAFEYARDGIHHSFDLDSEKVTISASEAMACGEGICFAKAHLLAALLRGVNIPAGFCYQRVMRKGTPESGYALHGLNAVYLPSQKRWIRLDPRGNKPGVNSQFTIEYEQLAYPIRTDLGEIDYPYVFATPPKEVISSMQESADCHELFFKRPEALSAF